MPTLTSTGAVNLTSSTNWSPALVPTTGDDLILNGPHNLTLDADMTLNSITFANNSARLVMPGGTTRVVQATNGFIVTASITIAVSTTLVAGMDLTLRGAWSGTSNNSISNIAASTGGNLTLEPAGGGTSGVIFADTLSGGGRGICSTWAGGTLTTRGLMNFLTATSGLGTLVSISGGTWNHTHTGSLTWSGASGVNIVSATGTANFNWSGDLNVNSTQSPGVFLLSSSGTHTISGTIKRTGSSPTSHGSSSTLSPLVLVSSTGTLTLTGTICSTKSSRAVTIVTAGIAGSRVNWRSQSLSIAATDAVIIMNGNATVFDVTSLVVTNAGTFTYVESGGATAVVDGTTSITNTSTSAQASVTSLSGALDGKIVNFPSPAPTLPTVAQVAAGTSYGYAATPLTGTGLIMDPATLATAMITSFSSLPEVMVRTTIATLASQTQFTLTAGSADNSVYNGLTAVITDQVTSVQKAVATISNYVGSTRTVTLSVAPGFTIATGDSISIIAGSSSGGGGSFPSEAPANWLRAAGIQDGAFTAAKFGTNAIAGQAVASVTGNVGGNVTGSVGSISGVSFPTNFGSMAITVGGAVTAGTVSDKTGYSLTPTTGLGNQTANITGNLSGSVGSVSSGVTLAANQDIRNVSGTLPAVTLAASQPNYAPLTTLGTNAPTGWINAAAIGTDAINASKIAADAVAEIADGVWDEDMSGHTGSTTYGGRIVRASNSNVTVQITGSNHIAADVHTCQPAGLTPSTEITAINTFSTRLTTMIEVDGLVYRYTTNALEQAPSSASSTDWTANERTAIRTILGIPGSGTTPADPSDGVLYDIKQKTDQIGSAGAITNLLAGAVLDPGTITSFPSELVIGDSYQETDGREIQIPLVDTDGNVLTTVGSRNLADATATFEIRRINESDSTRVITGVATIVDPPGTGTGAGAPYAIVELPADETAKGLVSYRYKGKLTLTWSGPGTDVYSFDTETIKFTY